MRLSVIIHKVFSKIGRVYRKSYFRAYTKCPHKDFNILGKIMLINKNIKIGRNVTIYQDCMFFGDGLIEIGDNVDVGSGTVIYASKFGGGNYRKQY